MAYVLIILLGTSIVRLFTLHRDTDEERNDVGYQLTVFIITFVFYTLFFNLLSLLM